MNKAAVALCCAGFTLSAWAEAPPAPPDPPFVAPMPNPGHWIRQAPEGSAGADKPSSAGTPTQPTEVSTETWLVGKNRVDTTTFSDGKRTEQFLVDGVCYESNGQKNEVFISDPRTGAPVTLPSVKDWSELTWVKADLYKGLGTAEGFKCYTYEEKTPEGIRRAMIEVTTLLPIVIEEPHRKSVYKYLTASSKLPKSESVEAGVDSYQKRLKSMSVNRRPR